MSRPVVALTDLGARGGEAIAFADRWAGPGRRLVVAMQRPRIDPIAPMFPHRARVDPTEEMDRAHAALLAQVEELTTRSTSDFELGDLEPGPIAIAAARFATAVDAEVLVVPWPLDLVDADGSWLLRDAPCPVLVAGEPGPGPVVAVLNHETRAHHVAVAASRAARRMARPLRSILARRDDYPAGLDDLDPRDAIARRIQALVTARTIRQDPAAPTPGQLMWVPLDPVTAIDEVAEQLHPALLVCEPPPAGAGEALQRSLEQLTVPLLVASPPAAA